VFSILRQLVPSGKSSTSSREELKRAKLDGEMKMKLEKAAKWPKIKETEFIFGP